MEIKQIFGHTVSIEDRNRLRDYQKKMSEDLAFLREQRLNPMPYTVEGGYVYEGEYFCMYSIDIGSEQYIFEFRVKEGDNKIGYQISRFPNGFWYQTYDISSLVHVIKNPPNTGDVTYIMMR